MKCYAFVFLGFYLRLGSFLEARRIRCQRVKDLSETKVLYRLVEDISLLAFSEKFPFAAASWFLIELPLSFGGFNALVVNSGLT